MENKFIHGKKIAIVCNIAAGKGRSSAVLKLLRQKLSDLSIESVSFTETWPDNFQGFRDIWLIGGDGTLNYFINQYPNIDIPIALFKGGTGNDFAWKLYGDKSIEEYFEMALNGKSKKVDIGICNGKYFINGVGIGFDGVVTKSMGKTKILPGYLSYLAVVLQKILFYREKMVVWVIDYKKRSEKIFMISIANGSRYGGGFLVAPDAEINDGEFDIVIIKCISSWKRFFYLPKVQKGKHMNSSFAEVFRGKKVLVCSDTPLFAHLDGELMEAGRFEIEILSQALLFIY